MKKNIALLLLLIGYGSSEAVAKHYSFSNGYPTTTTRERGASFGTSGKVQTDRTKKIEEKTLVGKVSLVESGDLIGVMTTGRRRTKVRLLRIDAPEQGQPFGVEAKKFLFDLVNGKDVTVRYFAKNSSETIDGTVYLPHAQGLVDVNLTLIKNGLAWYAKPDFPEGCKKDASREKTYLAAQNDAKAEKRGLWAAAKPVKPSEWRKLHQ